MKQYIFTSDYTASFGGMFSGTACAPQKFFKKGDIYPLSKASISPGWMQFYIASFPSNNINCGYSIPGNVVKEYNSKNISLKSTPTESSYFGGMQSEESQENLKTAFAVIGVAAYILIFYFLFTGYPKD